MRRGGRGRAGSRLGTRTRRWLIGGEVALSVVLIASAGLLARSLGRQLHSALGFHVSDGLTFEVSLPPVAYPETQGPTYMLHPRAVQFLAQALTNLRAIPGVEAVGIGKPLPLSGAQEATVFWREGAAPLAAGQSNPVAEYTVASPGMFAALGTPIVRGRAFTDDDRSGTLRVVIVNEAMARWLWPGQSPLGKRLKVGRELSQAPWMTVIGVSGDLKRYSLTESPRPEMFVPYTQQPYPTFRPMGFIVRSPRPTAGLLPLIRKAIAAVDPGIPVADVRTVVELVDAASANARLSARTTTAFGVAALVLAMIGLYGVVGFLVFQRRQEFGVRRALGATGAQIVRLVLRDGIAFVGLGLAAGLALAGGWAIRAQLSGVSAYDVTSLATSLGVLVAAGNTSGTVRRHEPRTSLKPGRTTRRPAPGTRPQPPAPRGPLPRVVARPASGKIVRHREPDAERREISLVSNCGCGIDHGANRHPGERATHAHAPRARLHGGRDTFHRLREVVDPGPSAVEVFD